MRDKSLPREIRFLTWGLAAALLATAATQALAAGASTDWPQYRGPNHDGISLETGWSDHWPSSGPKQIWKAAVGIGFSSISVSHGRVYTMGNTSDQDSVFCFDAAKGTKIWRQQYPCPTDAKFYEGGPSATPTIANDRVYTFGRQGDVFCFEAATGKVVWSTNLAAGLHLKIPMWGFAGSPYVAGDRVVLNAGTSGVCLDSSSGNVVWQSGEEEGGYSDPVPAEYDGQKCVVMFGAKTVNAVRVDNGTVVWTHPWNTLYEVNAADPIPFGNKVFVASGYDHGCSVFEVSGSQTRSLWENKNLRAHFTSSVLIDGYLYGIDGGAGNDAQLKCLDAATGKVQWKVDYIGTGGLFASDGKLVVLGARGELMVAKVSHKSFAAVSRAQVLGGKCWTAPILSDGRIYARNARGDLICLDVHE